MALQVPTISGVSPVANDTDVLLRPVIEVVFGGQSLIDPLSWGASTFALYGPGDVVLESGPGSILNSGLDDAPYPLLDGPLRRDRCTGTYQVLISGTSGMATAESVLGGSGIVLGRFTPDYPLNPNTTYVAVVVGNNASGILPAGDRRFLGITSYTSPSGFAQSGVINYSGITPSLSGATSGYIEVAQPYSKTLQTNQYNSSTGLNDIYTITIVSGTGNLEPGFKYKWSKASSGGTFTATVSGADLSDRHNLGDGLQIDFNGPFTSGEIHTLNTYIPKPLALSITWKFSTGEITSYGTIPTQPGAISVVIDETAGGGWGVSTVAQTSGAQFYVIDSNPVHLEYDVATGLSYIELQFNKSISSGVYAVSNVALTCTPLLGIPAPVASSGITPTRLETSGAYLKIYLP